MDKTVIVHDQRVYDELRRIKSTNRKLVVLAAVAGVYIWNLVKNYGALKGQVTELIEAKKGDA